MTAGVPFESEHRFIRALDKTWRWHLVRALPIRDERGTIVMWVGTATDIDDQKRAQDQVRASEERLSFALAAARMGTYDWDIVHNRIVWPEQTESLFGLAPGEFNGTWEHVSALVHPEDVANIADAVVQHGATGGPYEYEYRVIWPKDRSVHWLYTYGRTVCDDRGQPLRSIGVVLDITHRKRMEDDLRSAVRARDEFLSIASHELKTPITSLKLQLQMTQRAIDPATHKAPPPEKLAKVLDISTRQVLRLESLIEDLLDVARIQPGKLSLHYEPVQLAALIREVSERAEPQLIESNTPLHLDIDENIIGRWDRSRIEQVVVNLVSNAIKYAPGKPIEIRTRLAGEIARLEIADHGEGIPPEKHGIIFERFERVASPQHVTGLGLGLFIVKQIVEAHAGSITLDSDMGRGCTFIIMLPLTQHGQTQLRRTPS